MNPPKAKVGLQDTIVYGLPLTSQQATAVLQVQDLLLRPAVQGVENVFTSATRSGLVRRVVLTSSVAAVVGDHLEGGPGHMYDENDWNKTASDTFLPYHRYHIYSGLQGAVSALLHEVMTLSTGARYYQRDGLMSWRWSKTSGRCVAFAPQ